MPAQIKIAFKHIAEYPRPNPDQIRTQKPYFYMKDHENQDCAIKNRIIYVFLAIQSLAGFHLWLVHAPVPQFFTESVAYSIQRVMCATSSQDAGSIVPIGPPKGDRSEEFISIFMFVYRCWSNFI